MKRYPGKFEGCADQELAERLYEACGNGMQDEEIGDAESYGWFAVVTDEDGCRYIVREDWQGFFDYEQYSGVAWKRIEAMYAAGESEDSE